MAEERRNWTRDETIVAFNLYCKIPFSETTKTHPLIVKFAKVLNRTPSALSMKIGNLASLDPQLQARGVYGLVNRSRLDEEVWNEFNEDWNNLAFESERILAQLQQLDIEDAADDEQEEEVELPIGSDRLAVVKARVNQDFFRSALLTAYGNKCCITGLGVPQLLVASHIIPWTVRSDLRTNPRNGLLLNALHDKAFDKGLITVTTDYRIKISKFIDELVSDKIIKEWFADYSEKAIRLPERFLPSKEYLEWHNKNVFKG